MQINWRILENMMYHGPKKFDPRYSCEKVG